MPDLNKLHEQYKGRDDVVFVSVNVDNSEEAVRQAIEEHGINFPVLFSDTGWSDPAAVSFGVHSIPSSFVIGRDGRFAAEKLQSSELASAVKKALERPADPSLAGKRPDRLKVHVSLDDAKTAVPGLSLHLRVVGPDGKTLFEEEPRFPGRASRFVWPHPPVPEGGHLAVTARAEEFPEQTLKLEDPEDGAIASLRFTSPRVLSGRVATRDGTAVPGIKINAYRDDGFNRVATSDKEGRFRIPILPGDYSVEADFTDDFSYASTQYILVSVAPDSDPESILVPVQRNVALTGVVRDVAGEPVADAKVSAFYNKSATTDAQGRFRLPGVPIGFAKTVKATKGSAFGRVALDSVEASKDIEIAIGAKSENDDALFVGDTAPSLSLRPLLGGEQKTWRPSRDRNSLVVFCALWHPDGRAFLNEAATWAEQQGAELLPVSVDWSEEQAKRHLSRIEPQRVVHYSGPGGLDAAEWNFELPAQSFLISPEGKVLGAPGPVKLP